VDLQSAFFNCFHLTLIFLATESGLCRTCCQDLLGTGCTCLSHLVVRSQALLLSRPPSRIPDHATLWYATDNSASLFFRSFYNLTLSGLASSLNHVEPLAQNGKILISPLDGLDYSLTVAIEQLQLEQDTGKSLHDVYPDMTLMDLNRAGTGLMEIVTKPDMRTSKEAGILVKKLQALLRAVNSSDGNMDEVRVDLQVQLAITSFLPARDVIGYMSKPPVDTY